MSIDNALCEELSELLVVCNNGMATDEQFARLERLLDESEDARSFYVDAMDMHAILYGYSRQPPAADSERACAAVADRLPSIPDFSDLDRQPDIAPPGHSKTGVPNSEPSLPPLALLTGTPHTPIGYLASGWPLAYLLATVIFGIGLAIGAFTYVSQPTAGVATTPSVPMIPVVRSEAGNIGRITGMVNCRWEAPAPATVLGSYVALDRKYLLSSGLLEISYDTGAKVVLEGPAIYQVKSKNSGLLSVGKLTGRVEALTARGFSVHTPTAVITDLGTEFGVEVDNKGITSSHVFRGRVRVQSLSDKGTPDGDGQVLRENESVRVDVTNSDRKIAAVPAIGPADFMRAIPKSTIRMLDLVDVVAGGNGYSGRRGQGVNPRTGQVADVPRFEDLLGDIGDGKYHRVKSLPFVDGVFIPDGHSGPVQTDSNGHTFEFPATSNRTGGYVWAGGPIPASPDEPNGIPSKLGDVDYALSGHGLLWMHANKGITFDLDAIRRANPRDKLVRFRAVAGTTATGGYLADLWVLVDGKFRFRRCQINASSGVYSIAIPLSGNDRFLTLATTDGGDGISADWTIFGDPRLEFATRGASVATPPGKEAP